MCQATYVPPFLFPRVRFAIRIGRSEINSLVQIRVPKQAALLQC
jgi:hypothetical protein